MSGAPKLEWSKGRARITLPRASDGGPPPLPEAADAAPLNDPVTGRFTNPTLAARRRWLKKQTKGVTTLDPKRCASWLSPHVVDGAAHGLDLLQRFPDPALSRLVGNAADAHAVYRALLHLASSAGDTEALKESRQWLKEYRACLSTLSALSGGGHANDDDANDPLIAMMNAREAGE